MTLYNLISKFTIKLYFLKCYINTKLTISKILLAFCKYKNCSICDFHFPPNVHYTVTLLL